MAPAADPPAPESGAPRVPLHPPFEEIEPQASRLQRLRRLFESIDTDNDGSLTRQELLVRFTQMAQAGENASDSSRLANMGGTAESLAERLLEQSDEDGDGQISLDEFVHFMTKQERRLYDLFCELDSSGDGNLNPDEIQAACRRQGLEGNMEMIDRFVKHLSTDGDANISFPEFRAAFELNPSDVEFMGLIHYYQNIFEPTQGAGMIVIPQSASGGVLKKWIMASAMSGIMSRTVNAPLERIRIYLQLGGGDNAISGHPGKVFTREGRARLAQMFREAVSAISKDGGVISGLWRGNLVACMRIVPESMARMWAITNTRVLMARIEKPADGVTISHIPGKFAAGAAGAFSATAFVYPFDTVQTRMMAVMDRERNRLDRAAAEAAEAQTAAAATHAGSSASGASVQQPKPALARAYSTAAAVRPREHIIIDTVKEMWADGGVRAFYRGLLPTLVGIIPYAGTNIATFEWLKLQYINMLPAERNGRPSLWAIMGLGCLSGSVAEFVTYPISVVKSRMQTQGTQFNPDQYKNTLDCIRTIYRTHGPHGFYRGIFPTLMKAAPGVGVGFTCFELAKRALSL
ncbi:mitochondrial carrier domain-containing protein [Hyaloraphidium curvatum]|nr:mitochondrial carrier domain-containing protein [Hyaloraphidium curvatum]